MALRLLLALALLIAAGRPARRRRPLRRATRVAIFLERIRDSPGKGDGPGSPPTVAGSRRRRFRSRDDAHARRAGDQGARSDPAPGGGQRLLLEVFGARGNEARVFTWQVDCRARPARRQTRRRGASRDWTGCRSSPASTDSSLDTSRQFDVRDLTVNGPDLALRDASRRGVRRDNARRTDRYRPAGTRPAAVLAAGPVRAHAGAHLLGRRSSSTRNSMPCWSASGRRTSPPASPTAR